MRWGAPFKFLDENVTISADFSSKGGPKDLKGTITENGIQWKDGNKWLKVNKYHLSMNNAVCREGCEKFLSMAHVSEGWHKAYGPAFEKIQDHDIVGCQGLCDDVYPAGT